MYSVKGFELVKVDSLTKEKRYNRVYKTFATGLNFQEAKVIRNQNKNSQIVKE